ncbi:hypothetical protein M404DRAFT_1008340 [Pisolithus tinctorius Marx 270]|uniref:Uncharacterized protein n=1 Tax=Pisolithus tinctorius Marx 270 TaxID=870435 RepID=A0A0C3J9S8_PISTI|nr:hypothetical protein M404DRAFT_1008340 [Pisolithus tinctorius Marx 270]
MMGSAVVGSVEAFLGFVKFAYQPRTAMALTESSSSTHLRCFSAGETLPLNTI